MLQSAGQKILVGVFASTLLNLAAPVWAGDEPGYVMDKSGKPVMSKSGCVLAPKQPKTPMEECGDMMKSDTDADGDGIEDSMDKCPNTPKGVATDKNGCPKDSDGDGVADYIDACPNNTAEEIAGGVDEKGCPKDSDGDGVPDYRDKCLGTPATDIHKVNADGCVDEILRFDMNATAYFGFDKANLQAAGKHALNAMAKEANSRGTVQSVEIIGHADCVGSVEYNQKLSERRAKAAADYLMSLGMPANKITTKGVGKSQATMGCSASVKEREKDRKVIVDMLLAK